jgi:8-oxo-dGTP diphosphatase
MAPAMPEPIRRAFSVAVFCRHRGEILLIHHRRLDAWLPIGGEIEPGETPLEAARRELREETGLERICLEQLYTFGELARDPRERVVSVAYYALLQHGAHRVQAATAAPDAAWFAVDDLPALAFDQAQIVAMARARLRGKVRYQPIGFELLPPRFTLSQLQRLYEIVLERPLDKRNFRKKVLALGLLEELDEVEPDVAHRAARLYRFDQRRYHQLITRGLNFEL